MFADFFLKGFQSRAGQSAIIWRDKALSYGELGREVDGWERELENRGIGVGKVVSVEADFSPRSVALLLALIDRGATVVPLTDSVETKKPEFRETAEVEVGIALKGDDEPEFFETGIEVTHPLLLELRQRGHPGLILFSSGSTGKNKASLHDLVPFLEKFKVPRHAFRTITFLLFDHIGGVNTLLYTLSNGGCVIALEDRSPEAVCRAIQDHRAQLLPTSPTFLNLLLLSEAHRRFDLSSLELVTYGTEVMPETTLQRFHSIFPGIRLLQTYGLSEVGILRSKSRSSDSLWVKVGGEGFETRVVDGLLEIKAQSAMMGYLNHESPFTEDGWFKTGDAVEVDGEYIRILGRKSEIINVGGEKVYPIEVESVIQLMDEVEDVVVRGEANPITGQIVVALVKTKDAEDLKEFRAKLWKFCGERLPRFKVPQKVQLVAEGMHGPRFKKMR